jgi:hypothetical protein
MAELKTLDFAAKMDIYQKHYALLRKTYYDERSIATPQTIVEIDKATSQVLELMRKAISLETTGKEY